MSWGSLMFFCHAGWTVIFVVPGTTHDLCRVNVFKDVLHHSGAVERAHLTRTS